MRLILAISRYSEFYYDFNVSASSCTQLVDVFDDM